MHWLQLVHIHFPSERYRVPPSVLAIIVKISVNSGNSQTIHFRRSIGRPVESRSYCHSLLFMYLVWFFLLCLHKCRYFFSLFSQVLVLINGLLTQGISLSTFRKCRLVYPAAQFRDCRTSINVCSVNIKDAWLKFRHNDWTFAGSRF